MSIDLASAMRRALEHTRAQNLNEATAVIQAALAGDCPLRERPGSAGLFSPPAPASAPFTSMRIPETRPRAPPRGTLHKARRREARHHGAAQDRPRPLP